MSHHYALMLLGGRRLCVVRVKGPSTYATRAEWERHAGGEGPFACLLCDDPLDPCGECRYCGGADDPRWDGPGGLLDGGRERLSDAINL